MREVIFKIINKFTEGVDTYHNNGSMWLIFTDEKKWVIELTKEGTLWYNYYFFQDCFKYVSLDVVENQHYITEWVENIIQNGVKHTDWCQIGTSTSIEDAIQNGVKEVRPLEEWVNSEKIVDKTIQNGVKNTEPGIKSTLFTVEYTIQNGVKETKHNVWDGGLAMEEVIQNGIKKTEYVTDNLDVKNALQNGIKVTKGLGPSEVTEKEINKVINETHDDVYHNKGRVQGVINNGIKETIELPDKSGELNGYGEYYARQKNMTYPHDDIVNDIINDGIKETKYCELHSLMRADHIIRDGIKETKSVHIHNGESIESVIQNGIKETKRLKDENRPQIGNIIKQTNWRKVEHFPDYTDRITK